MSKIKMVICIGSSCFARGNARNVELTEKYLKEHNLTDEVDIDIAGGLCTGNCADGPIVVVNDQVYKQVDQGVMLDILNGLFAK